MINDNCFAFCYEVINYEGGELRISYRFIRGPVFVYNSDDGAISASQPSLCNPAVKARRKLALNDEENVVRRKDGGSQIIWCDVCGFGFLLTSGCRTNCSHSLGSMSYRLTTRKIRPRAAPNCPEGRPNLTNARSAIYNGRAPRTSRCTPSNR